MKNDIIYGVQKIEFGIPNSDGSLPSSWTIFENIEDGSVSLASNQDSKTNIIPEDKDVALLVLYTPGDPDVFNFALLEISHQNLGTLFNTEYDASTSSVTVLAQKKRANLAIKLTSRAQFGVKKVITIPNAVCEVSWKNNISKTTLLAISVAASALAYRTTSGKDAVYVIQTVNEDDSIIDNSADYDTTLDFTSDVSPTAAAITATIAATNATIKFKFDAISSPSGTPQNMVLKLSGVEVASVDYPSDYNGEPFKYITSAGVEHTGTFASGDVILT